MITAMVETLADMLPELIPLFPGHWEELGLNKDKVPLDPQYDEYLRREQAGQVLFVALREQGKLIGYFVGFVAPGLHYKTCLTLTLDIFYVVPAHRGAKAGVILFDAVRREAIRRGVQRWFVGNKEHSKIHAEALFLHLGFEKVETHYSLWLGG